jgi:CRISPR/Cas system-associated exonuclease Cas4 (RecB family)
VKEAPLLAPTLMRREVEAWAEGEKEESLLFSSMQKRGYINAKKSIFQEKNCNLAIAKPTFSLLPFVQNEQHLIPLSSSTIDMYALCPMKYVSSKVFGVKKNEYKEVLLDHGEIGNIQHSIYRQFFEKVEEEFGSIEIDNRESVYLLLQQIIEENIEKRLTWQLHLEPHVIQFIKNRYLSLLSSIVDLELKHFPSNRTRDVELTMYYRDQEKGYQLEGRIDRIIEKEDHGIAVIDYKKSRTPVKKEYSLEAQQLSSYQLPLYVLLLERGEDSCYKEVECGAYYNIEQTKYVVAFDNNRELIDHLIGISEQFITTIVDDIRAGKMGAIPSKKGCEHCDYRQVCRRRYSLP